MPKVKRITAERDIRSNFQSPGEMKTALNRNLVHSIIIMSAPMWIKLLRR